MFTIGQIAADIDAATLSIPKQSREENLVVKSLNRGPFPLAFIAKLHCMLSTKMGTQLIYCVMLICIFNYVNAGLISPQIGNANSCLSFLLRSNPLLYRLLFQIL